ncbi:hypothetical protein ABH935_006633 [Catenulispora sp. GAS73]|uniref:SAV_2336 N-terminal domain-related protein n=1 Tax=Catenulispora sp. GAS73 TaxID=3156269 RepID=UPI003510E9E9
MTGTGPEQLVRLLGALSLRAIDADPLELAEAVWLAEHMTHAAPDPASPPEFQRLDGVGPEAGRPPSSPRASRDWPPKMPLHLAGTESQGTNETGGVPDGEPEELPAATGYRVKVPAQASLPRQSEYVGALRDFKLLVPSGPASEFDEEATINASARSGTLVVRTRPRERPLLGALCVLDAGRSMPLWHGTTMDFTRLVKLSGVFRDVAVVTLSEDGALSGPVPETVANRKLDGPCATFVLTDGVGDGWRRPTVLKQLAKWARSGPTALINPLPERLWSRTAVRPVHGSVTALEPACPNTEMRFRVYGGMARSTVAQLRNGNRSRLTPVPVLELEPERVAEWASFVRAPSADGFACGLVFPTPRPTRQARAAGVDGVPDSGRLFLATASPMAVRLATHLAALKGWVNLPIMRYVQDIAVPESGPTHLAEVLLGGLLEQEAAHALPTAQSRYRFVESAREDLLRSLPVDADEWLANRIAQRISRAGESPGEWFPALVASPGSSAARVTDAPFAYARPDVVHRLAADPTDDAPMRHQQPTEAVVWEKRADRAHERFRSSGRMEDLNEALGHRIAALTHAGSKERSGFARRLAAQIAYRWLFSRDWREATRALESLRVNGVGAAEPLPVGDPYGLKQVLMSERTSKSSRTDQVLTTPAIAAVLLTLPPSMSSLIAAGQLLVQPGEDTLSFARDAVARQACKAERGLALITLATALSGAPRTPDPSPDDAAEAIAAFQEATTMVTEGDMPLSSWSQAAAHRALALARAEGGPEALDWAVGQLRGTVVRGSVLDTERAPLLADLATALRIRFDRDNSPGDLAEAILHLRTALGRDSAGDRLLPDDERGLCLRELGRDFEERFALNHRLTDLGEAADCYRQASELAEGNMPELYASCLVAWGRVLMRSLRYDDAREKLSQGLAAYVALGLSRHDTARVAGRLLAELDSTGR